MYLVVIIIVVILVFAYTLLSVMYSNTQNSIHWKEVKEVDQVRMDLQDNYYLERTVQTITWLESEEQEAVDYLNKLVERSDKRVRW